MAIVYTVGNIATAIQDREVDVVAHQCNCFNVMGSGVALTLSDLSKGVLLADKETVCGDRRKLGKFTTHYDEIFNVEFFNLYGQYGFSKDKINTDYRALGAALNSMAEYIKNTYLVHPRIGIPKIGAGIGGGEWDIICKLVEKYLGCFNVTVYVLDAEENPIPQRGNVVMNYSILTGDFQKDRLTFTWGTYGEHGDQTREYIPLYKLTTTHLYNILDYGGGSQRERDMVRKELNYRLCKRLDNIDDELMYDLWR